MELFLNSRLYHKRGYLYTPLLVDPSIEDRKNFRFDSLANIGKEPIDDQDSDSLVTFDGNKFVKSIKLDSLIENYESLFPVEYEQKRREIVDRIAQVSVDDIRIDEDLELLLFKVMPYFISEEKLDKRGVIELLFEEKIIPDSYKTKAQEHVNTTLLEKAVERIDSICISRRDLGEGILDGSKLKSWLDNTLNNYIIDKERDNMKQMILERNRLEGRNVDDIAALLYLQENRMVQYDNFGFYKEGDWVVYLETGRFALKDFTGEIYKFPNCRVGVGLSDIKHPQVLDPYKHPFLRYDRSGQTICLGHLSLNGGRTAENIIKSLEAGVNVILYGYINKSGFNGYQSLGWKSDSILLHDYFEDYRTTRDDPEIRSGEVEITNDFVKI